jgi:hypothetical protein
MGLVSFGWSGSRGRELVEHALLAAVALVVVSGHDGGCHGASGDPLPAPAQAVAIVLERPDGVSAELVVLNTAQSPPAPVDEARDATLTTPGGSAAFEAMGDGLYLLAERVALTAPGEGGYAVAFTLDEPSARAHGVTAGTFSLALHAHAVEPSAWMSASPAAVGEEARVAWAPAGLAGLVTVTGELGEVTYRNFDPRVGLSMARWESLPTEGEAVIEASAFAAPGRYRVELCAVDVALASQAPPASEPLHADSQEGVGAGLGWLSGIAVGRCAAALDVTVDP